MFEHRVLNIYSMFLCLLLGRSESTSLRRDPKSLVLHGNLIWKIVENHGVPLALDDGFHLHGHLFQHQLDPRVLEKSLNLQVIVP